MSRAEAAGDQRAITGKMAAKYDSEIEGDVISWFQAMIGEDLSPGMLAMHHALKSGVHLVNLAIKVRDGTANCPVKCKKMRLVPNTGAAPFKQMENIDVFLKFCENYGVPKTGLFQTVDLYECRNMAQVLASVAQLGTEAQRNHFSGSTIGVRPTQENRRQFSQDVLKAGHTVIGLQAGTNKFASQSGMSIGALRHVADIKADDFDRKGSHIMGQQAGSYNFANQSGMSIGGLRHGADIRMEDFDKAGSHIINMQSGSNKWASQARGQAGMAMGAIRHVSDIRADDFDKTGAVIGLQAGSNKGASQTGMMIGGSRHGADIRMDQYDPDSAAIVGLQMGSNQGATQAGMTFGGPRHCTDLVTGPGCPDGQAVIGLQMGYNRGATQSGMTFGATRHVADLPVHQTSAEGSAVLGLQMGTNQLASQSGMAMGSHRMM